MKKISKIIFGFLLLTIFVSCISRMARPRLTGTILDFDKKPIANCSIGETVTDKYGRFELPEIRYNKFFLTEIFVMEAPPVMVQEKIKKEGYEMKITNLFNRFGGGSKKGTIWRMDSIFLKKEKYEDFRKIIHNKWMIAVNPKIDTLFLIKANYNEVCKTMKCGKFWHEYNVHSENLLDGSVQKKWFKKHIVNLRKDGSYTVHKTDGLTSEIKETDSILTTGFFDYDEKSIRFKNEKKELNGKYEIIDFDYEYMKLKKTQ